MNDIEKREAYIVGKPPRIKPLDASEISEENKQVVLNLWQAIGIPPKPELPEFFGTMLRHPSLMIRQTEYATQLLQSELSARHRQLAIIRIAWLCQAPYEWSQHVKNSKRLAGLTSQDADQVTIGSSALQWDDQDRGILLAVEELYDQAMISDETWALLTSYLNDKQLLELPLLVGYYQSVAYLQNSVRFRLMPESDGLAQR